MIIGLSGKSGCGKDYIYKNIIRSHYDNAVLKKVATPLKGVVGMILDIAPETIGERSFKESTLSDYNMTGREFIQRVGYAMREKVDRDVWINAAFANCRQMLDIGLMPVFTDIRYPNEVEAIDRMGGIVIRVERYTTYNQWASIHNFGPNIYSDDMELISKEEFIDAANALGANTSTLTEESETALDDYDFKYRVQSYSYSDILRKDILNILKQII